MPTVLVVSGDRTTAEVLRRSLVDSFLAVRTAPDAAAAVHALEQSAPDLVLLDAAPAGTDPRIVLAAAPPGVPVVILAAGSSAQDRIDGFRRGAADCVARPFDPTEVVLRVQSVLRRGDQSAVRSFDGGRLTVDVARHVVSWDGAPLSLTPSEWAILAALTDAPHRVFARSELVRCIGGWSDEGYERAIDCHVKNLRRKLGDSDHRVIETVLGFGYRFGLDRSHDRPPLRATAVPIARP
jgi:two-component system alkaline phosphatase synthesis response regulator PhoP